MADAEVIRYLAAAIHVVVPGRTDDPGEAGLGNVTRLREALGRLTKEQRELVGRVFDGMLRERTDRYQVPTTDSIRRSGTSHISATNT